MAEDISCSSTTPDYWVCSEGSLSPDTVDCACIGGQWQCSGDCLGTDESPAEDCPAEPPLVLEDCAEIGTFCEYVDLDTCGPDNPLRTTCRCGAPTGQWDCEQDQDCG